MAYDEAYSGFYGCSLYNSDITMVYDDIHADGLLRLLNKGEKVLNLGQNEILDVNIVDANKFLNNNSLTSEKIINILSNTYGPK